MQDVTARLENWLFISYPLPDNQEGGVIWADIFEDKLQRFYDGDSFRSSYVQNNNFKEGDIITTFSGNVYSLGKPFSIKSTLSEETTTHE